MDCSCFNDNATACGAKCTASCISGAPLDASSSVCTTTHALSQCDLYEILMNTEGCSSAEVCLEKLELLGPLNNALEAFDMNCPDRIAAFVAQVLHETARLTTFYQPADDGAGAVHMLPSNFRLACEELPQLQADMALLPGCSRSGAGACMCGTDTEAALLVAAPEHAFMAGAWWFAYGSTHALKHLGCGDLRLSNDYRKISVCVFGGGVDSGLVQRLSFYDATKAITDRFQPRSCVLDHYPNATTCAFGAALATPGSESESGQDGQGGESEGTNSNSCSVAGQFTVPFTNSCGIFAGVCLGVLAVLYCICAHMRSKASRASRRKEKTKRGAQMQQQRMQQNPAAQPGVRLPPPSLPPPSMPHTHI
jgi:hypothetical protein